MTALTPSRHPAGSPDLAGVNQSPVHQHTGGFDKGQTADQPALWPDTSRRAGNLAGAIFRALMAERRRHPRGTPDHEYRTRAARKILWAMRGVPTTEWAA